MLSASIAGLTSAASSAASATRATSAKAAQSSGQSFADVVHAGVEQAHGMEAKAQSAVVDLLRGGTTEVHDAMIATQQSELAFELALQVRNKAVAAYQQMMQMQF